MAVSAAWSLIGRARRLVVFVGGEDQALRHSVEHFVSHLTWRAHASATGIRDPSLALACWRRQSGRRPG